MANQFRKELRLTLAWLVFPLVPAVLEDLYYQICNFELFVASPVGPDPHDWSWAKWVAMLGPLLGYGFLVGATLDIPNDLDPSRRVFRRFLGRRGVWVAVGPWVGLVFGIGVYFVVALASSVLNKLIPPQWWPDIQPPHWWNDPWVQQAISWVIGLLVIGTLAYGWLWPAWAALRRAARIDQWGRALYRGLVGALTFVGSLFGSFWAITWAWRSYFFDLRVMPLVALAIGVAVMSGCAAPITYGELRRRELFHAMLVAWVLGLALMWRWWSRRKPRPP